MSRWLVGSSSSRRLGFCRTISASVSRAFSPPEKWPIDGGRHVAVEVEAAQEVAQLLLARVGLELPQVPQRRVLLAQLLDLVLREVAEAQALRGVALSAHRRQRSGDGLQQRRLAGAVGAEEADAVAGQDAPVHVRQHRRSLGIAQHRVFEQHELARGLRRRREAELERAVDVRGRDELHPLQRLDPALRLLGLRRLRAEAVDERVQVRDLPLLLDVGCLLQRELARAFALELRVVAGVRDELARVDVHDAVDDGVEEVPVVRDEQQRARILAEPVLEPQHRVEVEVVRRLVEEQQVGPAHQRLREVQAHPPAAGEARDRVRVPVRAEAEPREQRRGARPRAVAADDFELMVQVGERLARVRGIGLGGSERAFDRAQFRVAVEHVVERAGRDRRRFLRDVRDRPRGRNVDRPGVRNELVAQRGEEARLAAAVRADDPELVAGMRGEIRAVEQALRAAGDREVGDPDQLGTKSLRV